MARDYLLELDGIKGESSDEGHKGAIEIESWSFGVSRPSTIGGGGGGGGGGAGKASFQDLHFSGRLDRAQPQLFLACATGQHIRQGILTVRRESGDGGSAEYCKVTFQDIVITSLDVAGAGGENGGNETESFSLSYSKITFEYFTTSPTGQPETVRASWDLAKGTKI